MRHIGVVAREFPPAHGGMPQVARHLARELSRHARVTIIGQGPGAACPAEALDAGPELRRELRGDLNEDRRVLRGLEAKGLEVDAWLLLNAGYAPLAGDLAAPAFVYFHGNDFLSPFLPMGLPDRLQRGLARFVGRPCSRLWLQRWKQRHIRSALASLRGLFTNSRNTRRLMVGHLGADPRRVVLLHPGVNPASFDAPAAGAGAPVDGSPRAEELRLLSVARLANPRKNIDGVLRAMTLLADLKPRLEVVGDGPLRDEYEHLARELRIDGQVRFCGEVDDAELRAAYHRADLFVLPTRTSERDVEGFGIVYLEASAAGTPVICAAGNGAEDAVRVGENGLVSPGPEPEQVAATIRRFAASRQRFTRERARAVARGFTWERAGARLARALERGLAGGVLARDGELPSAELPETDPEER